MKLICEELYKNASRRVLEQGEDFFFNGRVKKLVKLEPLLVQADILCAGNQMQRTAIRWNEQRAVVGLSCTCSDKKGSICKHVVAMAFAIDAHKGEIPSAEQEDRQRQTTTELLAEIPAERLREFITEYSREDRRFAGQVRLRFAKIDIKEEMVTIKEDLEIALIKHLKNGKLDYEGLQAICVLFDKQISSARMRLNWHHNRLGFHMVLYVLLTCMGIIPRALCDVGRAYEIAQLCSRIIHKAVKTIVEQGEPTDKVYGALLSAAKLPAFASWEEGCFNLLKTAAMLVNSKERQSALEELLASFAQLKDGAETHTITMREKNTRAVLLLMHHQMGGSEAASRYAKTQLEHDDMRETAVRLAMERGAFQLAHKLCEERIKQAARPVAPVWNSLLLEIAQHLKDKKKQIAIAQNLLDNGHWEAYYRLRDLLMDAGEWEKKHDKIFEDCVKRMPPHELRKMLVQEGEMELLYAEVQKEPKSAFEHAEQLGPIMGEPFFEIYAKQVEEFTLRACTRAEYLATANHIRTMLSHGGRKAALRLMDDFYTRYAHRPAMMEELDRVKR